MRGRDFSIRSRATLAILASVVFAAASLLAQTETVLHSFNQNGTDGYDPLASLVQQDGRLYGTTYGGGSYGDYGTVFELAPSSRGWTERVLHSFEGGSDGANPYYSSVVFDAVGNMYGTTQVGGTSGNGTVFKLMPSGSGWTESVLYSFTGGTDGGDAVSNVIFDKAGNLYGTTGEGGDLTCSPPIGCGTVFELSPQADGTWTESVLYAFTGGGDGGIPVASLVFDASGNLYGTTAYGGTGACNIDGLTGCGAVFELTPSSSGWTESVLYSFAGGMDGRSPQAALIFDTLGSLYSVTVYGGAYHLGTVFELTPSDAGWTESVLHSFAGGTDGANPLAGVILNQAGNLYGSTPAGGERGRGTVFELRPSSLGWKEALLSWFPIAADGDGPSGVILGQRGDLYGTTQLGGVHDWGTVFEITP